jgi:hypothetical protein
MYKGFVCTREGKNLKPTVLYLIPSKSHSAAVFMYILEEGPFYGMGHFEEIPYRARFTSRHLCYALELVLIVVVSPSLQSK